MTQLIVANFAEARLLENLAIDGTQMVISAAASLLFPTPGAGQVFRVTVYDGVQPPEIVEASTNPLSGIFTISRGKEGTTPAAWQAGSRIRCAPTAEFFNQLSGRSSFSSDYSEDVTFDSNEYTVELDSVVNKPLPGYELNFKVPTANSGAVTLIITDGVDSSPAYPVRAGNVALAANALGVGDIVSVTFTESDTYELSPHISTSRMRDSAVTTPKIASEAVTFEKLPSSVSGAAAITRRLSVPYTAATYTTLRAIPTATLTNTPVHVFVRGKAAEGDSKFNEFIWNADSLEDDNDFTVIRPNDKTSIQPGRWISITSGTLFLTPEMFGAVGDNVASDSQALRDWLSAMAATPRAAGLMRPGAIYVHDDDDLIIDFEHCTIYGNNGQIRTKNGAAERPFIVRETNYVNIYQLSLQDEPWEIWQLSATLAGPAVIVGQTVSNGDGAEGVVKAIDGTTVTIERTTVRFKFAQGDTVTFSGGATATLPWTFAYTSPTGTFDVGEAFTVTSGQTGIVQSVDVANSRITVIQLTGDDWTDAGGETLEGDDSGATVVIDAIYTRVGAGWYRPLRTGLALENSNHIVLEDISVSDYRFYGIGLFQNTETQEATACDDVRYARVKCYRCGWFGLEFFPKEPSHTQTGKDIYVEECGHEADAAGAGLKVGTYVTGAMLENVVSYRCRLGIACGSWEVLRITNLTVIDAYEYSIALGFGDHSLDIDPSFRSLVIKGVTIAHTPGFVPAGNFAGIYVLIKPQTDKQGTITIEDVKLIGLQYKVAEITNETEVYGLRLGDIDAVGCKGTFSFVNVRPSDYESGEVARGHMRRVNPANNIIYHCKTFTPQGQPRPTCGPTPPSHTEGTETNVDGIIWEALAYVGPNVAGPGEAGKNTVQYGPVGMVMERVTLDYTGAESATRGLIVRAKDSLIDATIIRGGSTPVLYAGTGNKGTIRLIACNATNETDSPGLTALDIDEESENEFELEIRNNTPTMWGAGQAVAKGAVRRTSRDRIYRYSVAGTTAGAEPTHEGGAAADNTATAVFIGTWVRPKKEWAGGLDVFADDYIVYNGITYIAGADGTLHASIPPSHTASTVVNGDVPLAYLLPADVGNVAFQASSAGTTQKLKIRGKGDLAYVRPKKAGNTIQIIEEGLYESVGNVRIFYGTAAPTTGTYNQGDRVKNTAPTAFKNIHEWVCQTTGSPGIWSAHGQGRGTTAQRPSLATGDAGYQYWDTTVSKIISWNGTTWDVP